MKSQRDLLADNLSSATQDAYNMTGVAYVRLNKILAALTAAVVLEDDKAIAEWTFAVMAATKKLRINQVQTKGTREDNGQTY